MTWVSTSASKGSPNRGGPLPGGPPGAGGPRGERGGGGETVCKFLAFGGAKLFVFRPAPKIEFVPRAKRGGGRKRGGGGGGGGGPGQGKRGGGGEDLFLWRGDGEVGGGGGAWGGGGGGGEPFWAGVFYCFVCVTRTTWRRNLLFLIVLLGSFFVCLLPHHFPPCTALSPCPCPGGGGGLLFGSGGVRGKKTKNKGDVRKGGRGEFSRGRAGPAGGLGG